MHQLTITLEGVGPSVWRRLIVPRDLTLDGVHDVVIAAMGWAGYHLCLSKISGRTYLEPGDDEEWPEDSIDPETVRLGDVMDVGDSFAFEYDFGDGWEHEVVVDRVRRNRPASRSLRPWARSWSAPRLS